MRLFSKLWNDEAKQLLAHIATGLGTPEPSWFAAAHPLSGVDIEFSQLDHENSSAEKETVAAECVSLDLTANPQTLEGRLALALKKIQDAFRVHTAALENPVETFCQNIEAIDTVEALSAALLGYSSTYNGYVVDTSAVPAANINYVAWS